MAILKVIDGLTGEEKEKPFYTRLLPLAIMKQVELCENLRAVTYHRYHRTQQDFSKPEAELKKYEKIWNKFEKKRESYYATTFRLLGVDHNLSIAEANLENLCMDLTDLRDKLPVGDPAYEATYDPVEEEEASS